MILLSSAGESFFQLVFALFVFVGVLALTAFVTKWIAGYQKTVGANKNLEIIEAIRLSNNKSVQIIRAGVDKYFVVATGKDEVTLLGELSSSQLRVSTITLLISSNIFCSPLLRKCLKLFS